MFHVIRVWLCAEKEGWELRAKNRREEERAGERATRWNPPIAHPRIHQGINLWVDEDGFLRCRPKSSWVG